MKSLAFIVISVVLLVVAIGLSGIESLITRLVNFPLWALSGLLALLLTNLLIVSLRFWQILKHFGAGLSFPVAFRANISGLVAGHFMITLFGQIVGRQAVLRNYGMQPVVIAGLVAYERVVIGLVSGALCLLGAIYLLGGAAIAEFVNRVSLPEIALAAGGGLGLSFWLGRSRFEKSMSSAALSRKNLARFLEILCLTLFARSLVLLTYVLGILAFRPDIAVLDLFSAAAVISFAAAMPITVNGWGVREIAAIYVLGYLGLPAADAVAVSILVGLCATLVIFAVAPFSLRNSEMNPFSKEPIGETGIQSLQPAVEFEKTAAWLLGMAVAVAVFFQAHIPFEESVINLNLADPFAILAIAAVAVHILFSRRLPVWRIQYFNLALGAVSLMLLVGFVRGWLEIGLTQWAFTRTMLGWLVILGYLAAGYLMVAYAGAHGLRRLSQTMVATLAVVVLLQIGLKLLDGWELNPGVYLTGYFDGYAANPNAFAFQLLTGMTLLLGYASLNARHLAAGLQPLQEIVFPLLLGIMLAGLYWTESRAGWGTVGMLILGAWAMRLVDTRLLVLGIAAAAALVSGVWLLSQVPVAAIVSGEFSLGWLFSGDGTGGQLFRSKDMLTIGAFSDHERGATFMYALELWRQSPIFGAGLGVFMENSPDWIGRPIVIHNTFLWILAEFGLVGVFVFCSVFFMLLRHAWISCRAAPAWRILLLLLVAFAIFSQTHEIFYQRIFWLVLGAVLAQPLAYRNQA